MANTYTQIHIQFVIAVKFRQALIHPGFKERLHQYITGIIRNNGHKLIAINSMPDHLHLFIGFRPDQSLSDLMRIVKGESSEWINQENFTPVKFRWQEGYGAFSYSRSQLSVVASYIYNQEEHHKKFSFAEEYKSFLEKFEIDYEDKYVFKSLE